MSRYLTKEEIIEIHDYLINEFGGAFGIRDNNSLEAAVMRPQSGYYKNIYQKAAALFESLTNNHPFVDGNKRIGFFAADIFLRLNGYFIKCENEKAYSHFKNLFEKREFNYNNLLRWIRANSKKL
jgi:death on curing protein